MLAEEIRERRRFSQYTGYFSRAAFLILLVIIGIHGTGDLRFRIAITLAALMLGLFWSFDQFFQRSRLQLLSYTIAMSEERSSPKYWQDNYIRYNYSLDRALRFSRLIFALEPPVWSFAAILVLWIKIVVGPAG